MISQVELFMWLNDIPYNLTDAANFDRDQFTDLLADPHLNIEAADKVTVKATSTQYSVSRADRPYFY